MKKPYLLVCAAFLAFAGPSHAADVGECGTPEQMTAKLGAEGQRSIAHGDLVTANHYKDKKRLGMIFTVNADKSVGYILQSDKPMGERAGRMCIYERMANVRLFDARKPTPAAALLAAPEADAHRRCNELAAHGEVKPRGSCGALNTIIRKTERFNDRVMMQGFFVRKQPDGSYAPINGLITISGNVDGDVNKFPDNPSAGIAGGILFSWLPEGATIISATLVYPRYTEYGLSLLQ
ncbi:hypothetical protein QOZ23_04620 [Pseudomonas aeruginosa]|uniref:hypothetical protein n=1 Tax=Pseudomonas aeruginosa TaxID=287 RepID=UPI00345939D8